MSYFGAYTNHFGWWHGLIGKVKKFRRRIGQTFVTVAAAFTFVTREPDETVVKRG